MGCESNRRCPVLTEQADGHLALCEEGVEGCDDPSTPHTHLCPLHLGRLQAGEDLPILAMAFRARPPTVAVSGTVH